MEENFVNLFLLRPKWRCDSEGKWDPKNGKMEEKWEKSVSFIYYPIMANVYVRIV